MKLLGHKIRRSIFLLCAVVGLAWPGFELSAQDSKTIDAATGMLDIPKLPEPGDGAVPTLISGAAALEYRKAIAPELFPLVRSNVFQLAAYAKLKYRWSYGDDWDRASELPSNTCAEGLPESMAKTPPGRSFPFGDEIFLKGEQDPTKLGQKVLLNSFVATSHPGLFEAGFTMISFKESKLHREFAGSIFRFFPKVLNPNQTGLQASRQLLQFISPPPVRTLKNLVVRFWGDNEDLFWTFSPALERARQLTGSNFADALVNTSLSMEDIFVWSGKLEGLEPHVSGSVNYMMPFFSADSLGLEPAGSGCASISGQADRFAAVKLGVSEGRQPWAIFSSAVVNVPRRLYRIELAQKDPFSLYGRQLLYVDSESMLPVMKLVFDRSGHLWKQVIGAPVLLSRGGRGYALMPLVLIQDYITQQAVLFLLEPSRIRLCDQESERLNSKLFDLAAFVGPTPTPKPTTK